MQTLRTHCKLWVFAASEDMNQKTIAQKPDNYNILLIWWLGRRCPSQKLVWDAVRLLWASMALLSAALGKPTLPGGARQPEHFLKPSSYRDLPWGTYRLLFS